MSQDYEYEHNQADLIAEVIQDALSHDEAEREAILTRNRDSVLHSIARLVDDVLDRPDDDPVLKALADLGKRPAYTESRLLLAGFDVIDAYDDRDFANLHERLHDLDEMSVAELRINRPESIWPFKK